MPSGLMQSPEPMQRVVSYASWAYYVFIEAVAA